MSTLRFKVVEEAFKKRPVPVTAPAERPSAYYATYVFNQDKMRKYLPLDVYRRYAETLDTGRPLDMHTANAIAQGMKQWAVEMGVTHYTHWFQPLTEGTAEKHDAFVEHDGKGGMIEDFAGKLLVQQEPDASSFPNGGIRSTFEARGYSAWDPASPVFIIDDTLMIPTVFISYTGEALDYKAPLKKSIAAVNHAAEAVCAYFYDEPVHVHTNLGWEQEYFLVDEGLYAARPDLLLTGRTLMGHDSAKNQQMEDHYFGAIPERVAEFMRDLEIQALRLGIPCKTRHNEVAPSLSSPPSTKSAIWLWITTCCSSRSCAKWRANTAFAAYSTRNPSPASTAAANTATGRSAPTPVSFFTPPVAPKATPFASSPSLSPRSWASIATTVC